MAKSNLDLIKECDNFPYYEDDRAAYTENLNNYHAFRVSGYDATLGYIIKSVVDQFPWPQEYWKIDSQAKTVTLITPAGADPALRSKLIAETIEEAVKQETFEVLKGWRNERYPVFAPGGEYIFEIERSAACLFGVVTYGAHMTGYVEDPAGVKLWIPRRAKNKQTYPSMLDNTVAGGMCTGEKPFECIVREAMEEASLPESVVRASILARGCVTYTHVRDPRAGGETGLLQPEVEYVYDLKLDPSVIPKPGDSEVEEFKLLSVSETQDALSRGEFKPNCAIILVDFFIRHGILTAENEPDYLDIVARLHRRLEYPTASHCVR
ncbi:thiamine pyrophosphokinase-related protein [Penicillium waksmanii]|uniref:thiamine pyrophosphokinase-related protein n=1 Tax=Penicillium waksmanii TaxID=69791 RepID=UPI0025477F60|nr:thiamine pyrophosphokinase-related protein [Penicillium waksmanii]KAJ5980585.1 thiamine pyrophosphokinase-related protein [Penicillium waksmanii]